ncbi:MAG: acetyl-CoA carboxylase carboxyltransferase subunit beta [Eubacterium sp.]|nr:acetyl-CoA carboxylase carboxyltransferase subunit beta [Eubacterium sp.]
MKLQTLFKKNNKKYININKNKDVPDGILRKCKKCNSVVFAKDVAENNYICPKCGGYFRVHAKRRIEMIADKDSFIPWFQGIEEENPLNYPNYEKRLKSIKEKTGLDEAVTTGEITITGIRVAVGVCDGRFLMASMGSVVGEKITRLIEVSISRKLPLILVCASGGARMQEGIYSLMQMAKTSAALAKHHQAGLLYLSVLTQPTMGGVTASFATLGDIIIAEKGAAIGFAGRRVVEQTIKQSLPDHFQTAEFLQEKGLVDIVVSRQKLKQTISELVELHEGSDA